MKRAGLGAAVVAIGAAACSVDPTHVYVARRFEPALACLDPYTAIDVISGADTGSGCALVCLTSQNEHYVSRQCPPYPPLFGVASGDGGADPICAAALATYAIGDTCDLDGGVIHRDGGADAADAASDGASDGAADAASDGADGADAAPVADAAGD